jgi:hypothetical protein
LDAVAAPTGTGCATLASGATGAAVAATFRKPTIGGRKAIASLTAGPACTALAPCTSGDGLVDGIGLNCHRVD